MSLFKSLQGKKFDKRMVEWNLKNGVISQAEYDQFMKDLPDLKGRSAIISLVDKEDHSSSRSESNGSAGSSDGFSHH